MADGSCHLSRFTGWTRSLSISQVDSKTCSADANTPDDLAIIKLFRAKIAHLNTLSRSGPIANYPRMSGSRHWRCTGQNQDGAW
jgi:hypothetical protein